MHLVKGQSKLHAIIGDAIVNAHGLIKMQDVGSLARFFRMDAVGALLCKTAQSFGMVLLNRRAFLQKVGKVLHQYISTRSFATQITREHTRAEAMLCLRRFKRVLIPIYLVLVSVRLQQDAQTNV